MKPSEFLIVVVLYESDLTESLTFRSLLKIQSTVATFPEILIYDNSKVSMYNDVYAKNIYAYLHNPSNSGVAGAYNYAITLGRSIGKKWLVLFDQDTSVREDYFSCLYNSIERYPEEVLFCPKVRSNKKIVSPALYYANKAFCLKDVKAGLLKSRNHMLINSGLVINIDLLQNLGGYNEELPLDYSDHYFFVKYKKLRKDFVVIDCENQHFLSSNSDESFDKVYSRFKKYCGSTFVYAQKVKSTLPVIWLYLRTVKLTFKFSTFDFFKYLLYKK